MWWYLTLKAFAKSSPNCAKGFVDNTVTLKASANSSCCETLGPRHLIVGRNSEKVVSVVVATLSELRLVKTVSFVPRVASATVDWNLPKLFSVRLTLESKRRRPDSQHAPLDEFSRWLSNSRNLVAILFAALRVLACALLNAGTWLTNLIRKSRIPLLPTPFRR